MLLTPVGVCCDYVSDTVFVSMCSQYYSPPWCHLSVTAGSVSGGLCARCKGCRVVLVPVMDEEAGPSRTAALLHRVVSLCCWKQSGVDMGGGQVH